MAKKFNIKKLDIKGIAVNTVGNFGGGYAAIKANKIQKIKDMQPWVRGLIKLSIGALLPPVLTPYVKDKTLQSGLEGFGAGMRTIGGLEIASKFDTSIPAIEGGSDVMGNVMFDEEYTRSGVSGSDDVLGGTQRTNSGTVINM